MAPLRGPTLKARVRGRYACFTRPELKVERVSYEVPTPSAMRGVLEAICWKPAIQWHIERIHVLKPICFASFRRNEVSTRASVPARAVVTGGGQVGHYFVEDDRAQRNTVALTNVDYVVEAHFTLTERAGDADNIPKFVDMFCRRVAKGQHFHQPYLGCREFPAEILPVEDIPPAVDETRELGLMLWDMDFSAKRPQPRFFAARLCRGVLEVPADPESTLAFNDGENS